MARIRTIKPEFFTDEEIGELAPLDRLFFVGLWCHADRAGRLKDKPRQLKVQILPYDRYNVDEGLAKLIEMRFLLRYAVDGESYLQIRTWDAHQRPHHTERQSTYPACNNGDLTVNEPLDNSETEEGREGKGREGKGKEVEGKGVSALVPKPSDLVVQHYQTFHHKAKPGQKERLLIGERLRDGYSVEDLCHAIDGCHVTPHNLGANDRDTPYLSLELILRNSSQVTRFIENAARPPRPTNEKERRTLDAANAWIERVSG